eukprot:1420900-Amphidinium_carterae.1
MQVGNQWKRKYAQANRQRKRRQCDDHAQEHSLHFARDEHRKEVGEVDGREVTKVDHQAQTMNSIATTMPRHATMAWADPQLRM